MSTSSSAPTSHARAIRPPDRTATRASSAGCRRLLLAAPEIQHRRGRGAADHAWQAERHLSGGGRRDAAERQRALPDLTPGRHVALVAGTLALELLHGGERVLAHARGLHGLGRLDHLVEDRVLAFALAGALEHPQELHVARRVAGERVLGHAADGEPVDAVAVLRPGQQGDDARDRPVGAGGEIVSPQRVEQLGAAVKGRIAGRRFLRLVEIAAHLLDQRGVLLLERNLIEDRQLALEVLVYYDLVVRTSRGQSALVTLTTGMVRVG